MNKELTFLQKEHTPASPSYLMTLQPDGGLPRLLISPPRTGNCPLRGRMFEMDSNTATGLKTENLNQQRVFLLLADTSVLALSRERCCNVRTFTWD